MRIRVKLFAVLRDKAGVGEMSLELDEGATVARAREALAEQTPAVAPYLARVAFAVNQAYAPPETMLRDGDELAVIPPVSGGTDEDWVEISGEALDVGQAVEFVSDPRAGGIDIFLGTTRQEEKRELLALEYEAYSEMALSQMRALAVEARRKWPVIKLALLHRTGRVGLAEPSVVIAVSTPHRGQAFEACRFLIDMLKKDVAIWKKEVWADGGATWVDPGASGAP